MEERELPDLAEGVEANRGMIRDNRERVGDAVQRVDTTREEFQEFRAELESELESEVESLRRNDRQVLAAVESNSRVNRRQAEVLDILNGAMESNQEVQEAMLAELRQLRRLQESSMWDRARSVFRSAFQGLQELISG